MADAKPKSRVTYSREMRTEAKAKGRTVATVHVEGGDGTKHEWQFLVDPNQFRFLLWAAAVVENGEELGIDLEDVVRSRIEALAKKQAED